MPLTAEEKKQKKLEKKAQKLREAEELRIKIRKDELTREVEASRAVSEQHRSRWYKEVYAANFPLIKGEMEAAWRWYEHTLDIKDFIASHLIDALDEIRVQQDISWQDFSLKMDDLINHFHQRIKKLDDEYQHEKQYLLKNSTLCRLLIGEKATELEEYYMTIIYAMEEKFQEVSAITQSEFLTKRDEEAKKGTHQNDVLTVTLEHNVDAAVKDIINILQKYKDETEIRRRDVETMKIKDDFLIDMISRQDVRMSGLCEDLSHLQSQINEKHETKLQLEDLKKGREEAYSEYMAMRAKLTRETTLDNNQLLTVTAVSNCVLQDLEKVVEKGEKILRLGILCNRLETQEEKVLPFGFPALIKTEALDDHNHLRLFWRRYARAKLTKRKLDSVHVELEKENKYLTQQLQNAFEILSQTRA